MIDSLVPWIFNYDACISVGLQQSASGHIVDTKALKSF